MTPPPIPAPSAPSVPALLPLPASGSPTCVVHKIERPANMILVAHLRPNSDPMGDSKATFYVSASTTPADIQAWVAQEKTRVVAEYLAAHITASTLIAAIGT